MANEDFSERGNENLAEEILRVLGEILDRYKQRQVQVNDDTDAGFSKPEFLVEPPTPIGVPYQPVPQALEGFTPTQQGQSVPAPEPIEIPNPPDPSRMPAGQDFGTVQFEVPLSAPQLPPVEPARSTDPMPFPTVPGGSGQEAAQSSPFQSASPNVNNDIGGQAAPPEIPQSPEPVEFQSTSSSLPRFVPVTPFPEFEVDQQREDEYARAQYELPDDTQARIVSAQSRQYQREANDMVTEIFVGLTMDSIQHRDNLRAIHSSYMRERI